MFFVIHKYLGFHNEYVWQMLDEFRQNILAIELSHENHISVLY